jgi:hypothetical protein
MRQPFREALEEAEEIRLKAGVQPGEIFLQNPSMREDLVAQQSRIPASGPLPK